MLGRLLLEVLVGGLLRARVVDDDSKREEEEVPPISLPAFEASGPPSKRKRAEPARLQIAAVRCSLLFRLVRWVLFVMVPTCNYGRR